MDECTQGALNRQSNEELKSQTEMLFGLVAKQTETLNSVARKVDVMATDVGWLKSELEGHIGNSVGNIKQIADNALEVKSVSSGLTQCWALLGITFASVVGMAFMIIQDFLKK